MLQSSDVVWDSDYLECLVCVRIQQVSNAWSDLSLGFFYFESWKSNEIAEEK